MPRGGRRIHADRLHSGEARPHTTARFATGPTPQFMSAGLVHVRVSHRPLSGKSTLRSATMRGRAIRPARTRGHHLPLPAPEHGGHDVETNYSAECR